jgi:hypothetical protein
MRNSSDLHKQLAIGIKYSDGSFIKDYSLMRSNGIAERVFTDRPSTKPFTWMGNVLSVACSSIGDFQIGGQVRAEYAKSEQVIIPQVIKDIPFNDANTMLVEVHRSVWKNLIRNQESLCKYCGRNFVMDIDLNRLDFTDEQKLQLAKERDWNELVVDLPYGWEFPGLNEADGSQAESYSQYKGVVFDQLTFRLPTLGDAIKNERYYDDNIMFWRRIAWDCLERITSTANSTELPTSIKTIYGLKLFNEQFDKEDLEAIRNAIRDEPPTMPGTYRETCPHCKQETPVSMEVGSLFSE